MSDAMTGQITAEAAELYEEFFVPALFAQWPNRLFDLAGLGAGDDVLDVACGTGVLARAAQSRVTPAGSVTGIDLNGGMLSVAARTAPDVIWLPGAAEELPGGDDAFDRVFCQFGLMFFAGRVGAIHEMARVLRPEGRACVATWAGLPESPGYAALVELLEELFGAEPAQALAAPFSIGTAGALSELMSAGFAEVDVHRLDGQAHFPSIDAWVATDVRAWTLRDMLDDEQFEELRVRARATLHDFCDASGEVVFSAPALVAVAHA